MGDDRGASGPNPSPGAESRGKAPVGIEAAVQTRADRASRRLRDVISEQLGLRGIVSEYMIPVDTNTIWYTLGGVLAISLLLEIVSGFFLALRYLPDAGRAYGTTALLLRERGWSVDLNFHFAARATVRRRALARLGGALLALGVIARLFATG